MPAPIALIYAHRTLTDKAVERTVALRKDGFKATYCDTRGFNGDTPAADLVVTDDPVVRKAYEAKGVKVEAFQEKPLPMAPHDIPAPAPAAKGGDPVSEAPRTRRKR